MRHKKILLGIALIGAIFLAGCSKANTYTKQSAKEHPVTKTQVVKYSQKDFDNGEALYSVTLNDGKHKHTIKSDYEFGSKPTIFHVIGRMQSGKKQMYTDNYLDIDNSYARTTGWKRTDYDKITGKNYASLVNNIVNNDLIFNPDKRLVKAYTLKNNAGQDTQLLSATVRDSAVMKKYAATMADLASQSKSQKELFRELIKRGKFQIMTSKAVVHAKRLTAFSSAITLKYDKYVIKLEEGYFNFGKHSKMQIPDEVINNARNK